VSDVTQTAADAVALSDAASIQNGIPRLAADSVALSDVLNNVLPIVGPTPADQLIFVDSINVKNIHPVPPREADPLDTLGFNDGFTILLTLNSPFTDTFTFSDAISVSGAGILDIGRAGGDALALSDITSLVPPSLSGDFISYIRRYLNDVI
jgi:hypothetical protein